MEIFLIVKSLIKQDPALAVETNYGLTVFIFSGFVLFIILYALEYRDFSVMKAIFLYPAILAFPLLFLRAGERLNTFLKGRFSWVRIGVGVWHVVLFVLFSADIVTMIALLYSRRFGM
jgi:hypothetical protein